MRITEPTAPGLHGLEIVKLFGNRLLETQKVQL
jgi:hypothetical protein